MILGPEETKDLIGYEVYHGRDGENKLYDSITLRYKREFKIFPGYSIPYVGTRTIRFYCIFARMDEKSKTRLFDSNPEYVELEKMLKRFFTEEWAKKGVTL